MMRVCVLVSSADGSTSPIRQRALYGDPTSALAPSHEVSRCLVRRDTAEAQLAELARGGQDVFLNLCDGSPDEDCAGIEVVQFLESAGLPFTGAGSGFYGLTRREMKQACAGLGLSTPRGVFVDEAGEWDVAMTLRFPLIVKHPNSYGSIGLSARSRVATAEELRAQVARMVSAYGGALVEEFIEGREFTVLVMSSAVAGGAPLTLRPLELSFSTRDSFKHFGVKWGRSSLLRHAELPALRLLWQTLGSAWGRRARAGLPVTDTGLEERLRAVAAALFAGLGGDGYARCDLRLDSAGEVQVLDMNPNCAVFYPPHARASADVILEHDPMGQRGFAERLLEAAGRRAGISSGVTV